MTSYEFEKVAKNAVVDELKTDFGIETELSDLQFVWFAWEMGNMKCTIYTPVMGHYYAEVTYNLNKEEMYVDIYQKQKKVVLNKSEFNFNAE